MNYSILGLGNVSLDCNVPMDSFHHGLADNVVEKIEKEWSKALKINEGKLFDGVLLNCNHVEITSDFIRVHGGFIDYKYFWAKKNLSNLVLNITPVGVSGMVIISDNNEDYILFGTRTNVNLQYKGYYELIPSGGISIPPKNLGEIDYFSHLKNELKEETGIDSSFITSLECLGLLFDENDNVFDIGCLLQIKFDRQNLNLLMNSSTEYTDVKFVPIGQLELFVQHNANKIVPTSIGLVQMYNNRKN